MFLTRLLILTFLVANTQAAAHAVKHHWQGLAGEQLHTALICGSDNQALAAGQTGGREAPDADFDCGLCQLSLGGELSGAQSGNSPSFTASVPIAVSVDVFVSASHRLRPPGRAPPAEKLI